MGHEDDSRCNYRRDGASPMDAGKDICLGEMDAKR